jgi:protein-S-isoprenylcysteine O-methyltransferase Ste14
LTNAWLLCLPLVAGGLYLGIARKDVAKRMSDMTGYTAAEKIITISASIAPYPFMIVTAWTPFTSNKPFLVVGSIVYSFGMALLVSTVHTFVKTPIDIPVVDGLYRYSRNPLYLSATLVFSGICMATTNLVLLAILIVLFTLQHFMILAEERACRQNFGMAYERYVEKVPRYLRGF